MCTWQWRHFVNFKHCPCKVQIKQIKISNAQETFIFHPKKNWIDFFKAAIRWGWEWVQFIHLCINFQTTQRLIKYHFRMSLIRIEELLVQEFITFLVIVCTISPEYKFEFHKNTFYYYQNCSQWANIYHMSHLSVKRKNSVTPINSNKWL